MVTIKVTMKALVNAIVCLCCKAASYEGNGRSERGQKPWGLLPWVRIPPLPPYFLTGVSGLPKRPVEQNWLRHRQCSGREDAMIRANCRERFTAADFDFIIRTLARSRGDSVSLVELLSDSDARDSILDHPKLVETILSRAGHL